MTCSFCGKEGKLVKGFCKPCYYRNKRHGSPEYVKVKNNDPCSVCGTPPVASRGLCKKHYQRWIRHGHTDQTRQDHWGEHAKHPLYRLWSGIRQRCLNPTSKDYHRYGGRNVTICERYGVFMNFVADMGERPGPHYSVERKDTNGNYCPENCIWADAKTQARNRRNGVLTAELAGEIKRRLAFGNSISNIARSMNVPYSSVENVKRGLSWA